MSQGTGLSPNLALARPHYQESREEGVAYVGQWPPPQHGWWLRLHLCTAEPNQRLFVVLPVESMSVNKQETGNATDVVCTQACMWCCAHREARGYTSSSVVFYLLKASLSIPGTPPSDEAGQPMSSRELPVFTLGLQMCGALPGCPRGAGDPHWNRHSWVAGALYIKPMFYTTLNEACLF